MRREFEGVIMDDKRKEFVFQVPTRSGVVAMGTKANTEEQAKRIIDLYLEEVGREEEARAA